MIQLSVRSRRCGADAVKTVVRSLHWGSTTSWVLLLVRCEGDMTRKEQNTCQ